MELGWSHGGGIVPDFFEIVWLDGEDVGGELGELFHLNGGSFGINTPDCSIVEDPVVFVPYHGFGVNTHGKIDSFEYIERALLFDDVTVANEVLVRDGLLNAKKCTPCFWDEGEYHNIFELFGDGKVSVPHIKGVVGTIDNNIVVIFESVNIVEGNFFKDEFFVPEVLLVEGENNMLLKNSNGEEGKNGCEEEGVEHDSAEADSSCYHGTEFVVVGESGEDDNSTEGEGKGEKDHCPVYAFMEVHDEDIPTSCSFGIEAQKLEDLNNFIEYNNAYKGKESYSDKLSENIPIKDGWLVVFPPDREFLFDG